MRSKDVVPLLIALVCLSACAAKAPPYDPFRIGKAEIRQRVHTIALAPVAVPTDLEEPQPVQDLFESLIAQKLAELGFAVVPSRDTYPIYERIRGEIGGVYDPITGAPDQKKMDAVHRHTLDEIARTYHADALLHPSIQVVKAGFGSGVASWWGAQQKIRSTGTAVLEVLGGITTSGTVGATIVSVVIEDMSGVDLYENHGGIEVLAWQMMGHFEARPRSELFVDQERNRHAVAYALDPLSEKPLTPPTPEKKAATQGRRAP